MKTLVASSASLLLGLVIGWYVEYCHAEREMSGVVKQMVESIESSDREKAARAIRAIELIQSGEGSNAVQLLCRPIGDFYRCYANLQHNDKRTKDLLVWIDQVASTNTVVADEIHAKIP